MDSGRTVGTVLATGARTWNLTARIPVDFAVVVLDEKVIHYLPVSDYICVVLWYILILIMYWILGRKYEGKCVHF